MVIHGGPAATVAVLRYPSLADNCKGTTVAHTGFIDWPRLTRSTAWTNTGEGTTSVYAFWVADYPVSDTGLAMLRADGMHPDWFCAGMRVDQVISAELRPTDVVSPNLTDVFDNGLYARPLLGAICLGSASATYAVADRTRYWWAAPEDLNRSGVKIIKEVTELYARRPVILTFLDFAPIKHMVPGAPSDTATVVKAPGH